METKPNQIFRKGSTTYYYSSRFFPKEMLEEVSTLYAYVRVVDDFVDQVKPDKQQFFSIKKLTEDAMKGNRTENAIVSNFINLADKRGFHSEWIEAFLASMQMDLEKSFYQTLEETEEYIYGSAEVIGLMMAKIMQLPDESFSLAKKLGKSMQYINFLRDLKEDLLLGRVYLPKELWSKHGLTSLREEDARMHTIEFIQFYREELLRYEKWDDQARSGFHYLPKRFRIPIKTAADSYRWTAGKIYKNPLIVYEKKIKPRKSQVIFRGLLNSIQV